MRTTLTRNSDDTSLTTTPFVSSSENAVLTYWRKKKHEITAKDMSECDNEKIHLIGHIQGKLGSVLFASFPKGKVIACNGRIRAIPWVRQRGKPSRKRCGRYSNYHKNSDTNSRDRVPYLIPLRFQFLNALFRKRIWK